MHKALGAQPFNYTDAVDALPNSVLAFGSLAQNDDVINSDGLFNDSAVFDISHANTIGQADDDSVGGAAASQRGDLAARGAATVSNGVSDAGVFVLAESALNMHCWGENPVVTAAPA